MLFLLLLVIYCFFLEMILLGMVLWQSPRSSLTWIRVTAGMSGMALPPGDLSLIFLKAKITPSCKDSCPQSVLPKKHHFSLEGCCPKLTFTQGGQGRGRGADCKAQTQKSARAQAMFFLCWDGSAAKCKTISLIVMKTRPKDLLKPQ